MPLAMLAGQCQRPQIEDLRGFQLSQICRRFSQREQNDSGGTLLIFQMRPSGPDFPFGIEALDCVLCILFDYPEMGKPSLTVKNPNMERRLLDQCREGIRIR